MRFVINDEDARHRLLSELRLSQPIREAVAAELDGCTPTEAVHCDEQLRPAKFRRLLEKLFEGMWPAISKQIEDV